jgi:dTDP-glucose 4,6-dehydratase
MYDEAKRFSEAAVMAFHRKYRLDTRIVRIFNTYGPRMRLDDGRVVPNLLQQAIRKEPLSIYGDGLQTRSFCYVDDLIEGICRLLLSGENMPVNIGNPTETSILDFAKRINALSGNPSGLVYLPDNRLGNDPQRRQPDIQRARSILNWQPVVDLDEGLRRTLLYFREAMGAE